MPDKTVVINVDCMGKKHRIEFHPAGPVVLCNHKSVKQAMTLHALSGGECTCAKVILTTREHASCPWLGLPRRRKPSGSREWLVNINNKRHDRMQQKKRAFSSVSEWCWDRLHDRLRRRVQSAERQCNYAGVEDRDVKMTMPGAARTAKIETKEEWERRGSGWHIYRKNTEVIFHATLDYRWLFDVPEPVIDGKFILEHHDDGTLTAVRQGRGYNVYPCRGRITRRGKIRWL